MSASVMPNLDFEEQRARILNSLDESDKFRAEQRKLIAESLKLDRDRTTAPWITGAAVLGAVLGLLNLATVLMHWK